MRLPIVSSYIACSSLCFPVLLQADELIAPPAEEQQVPYAMHSQMAELPSISVGATDADIIGADERALQAAVDYIAGLGGGQVRLKAGEEFAPEPRKCQLWICIEGSAMIGGEAVAAGEVWLLPETGEQPEVRGTARFLRTYLPDPEIVDPL